jgi:hypothetical protein
VAFSQTTFTPRESGFGFPQHGGRSDSAAANWWEFPLFPFSLSLPFILLFRGMHQIEAAAQE